MIIYNRTKPVDCTESDCVGTAGDNLAYTQEFYIKGISDETISYTLHIRFCDGSVNSVTPSTVYTDGKGTLIRWVITKNDIFVHGSFELQIEGRNSLGLVYQTEIVRLYANESLPVEDKEYENPNSETLKLRQEAYEALSKLQAQQKKLDENIAEINAASLNAKADKITTYTKTEVNTELAKKENLSNKTTKITDNDSDEAYPTSNAIKDYLYKYYYDSDEADSLFQATLIEGDNVSIDNIKGRSIISVDLSKKADKSNTYTITQVDSKLESKADKSNTYTIAQVNSKLESKADKTDTYTIAQVDSKLEDKADKSDVYNKAQTDSKLEAKESSSNKTTLINDTSTDLQYPSAKAVFTELSNKFDASKVSSGSGNMTVYSSDMPIKSAKFNYQCVGDFATVTIEIKFSAASMGATKSYTLLGLPYKNDTIFRTPIVTTAKNKLAIAVGNNTSTLTILTQGESVSIAEDESIQAVLTYKIKE